MCGLNKVNTNSRERCWGVLLALFHENSNRVLGYRFVPALLVKEMEAIIIGKPREFKMDPII